MCNVHELRMETEAAAIECEMNVERKKKQQRTERQRVWEKKLDEKQRKIELKRKGWSWELQMNTAREKRKNEA